MLCNVLFNKQWVMTFAELIATELQVGLVPYLITSRPMDRIQLIYN